jgi:hypothetical protein
MLGLVVAAVWLAGSAALTDQGGEDTPDVASREQAAYGQIHDLRTVARKLKRLSSELERSGGADDYAAWLGRSRHRVDALAKRWTAGIDLYHREFPPESLADDPERAAYAASWIDQKNGEFRNQVLTLQRELLAANTTFGGAPKASMGRARAILDGMGDGQPAR